MPALNFQSQFAPLVESGEKRQTVRRYRKDGRDPKPGDTLQLYTGMRTKKCRKLREAECVTVEPVTIGWTYALINGAMHWFDIARDRPILRDLAEADGFTDYGEMRRWFERTHGLPFEGLLIRW